MSKNIRNIKSAIGNTLDVATSTIDVSTEVLSDASSMAVSTVRGVLPTTKKLGSICGMFIAGMANHERTPEEARAIYEATSVSSILDSIEQLALEAGQELMKDDDEDTRTQLEKDQAAEIEALKAELTK